LREWQRAASTGVYRRIEAPSLLDLGFAPGGVFACLVKQVLVMADLAGCLTTS
jgi:hypothetical protein